MTAVRTYRIAIVGASSLAGKELSDALSESSFAASHFTLLDEDEVIGQIATAGDEISFIQKIDESSFEGIDVVFFAGNGMIAERHSEAARKAGASIVDLTASSARHRELPVRSAALLATKTGRDTFNLNLETTALISAHPAAIMLALVAVKLAAKFPIKSFSATVLEPASQYGRPAMDELHQQTVSLLSFQPLPREQYDAQIAFNLLAALGEDAKIKLEDTASIIRAHFEVLTGTPLDLQLIQAPVFHGYVASVFVELAGPASLEEVEVSLLGAPVDLVARESEPPSNLSAAGQEEIMVRVQFAGKGDEQSNRFKLLIAADNLKLAAVNAIACARELVQLRPLGKVQ